MAERKIYRNDSGTTYFYIPAFIRDKFNMKKGDMVDIDDEGDKIILRFPGVE